jgi:hypothetical protein
MTWRWFSLLFFLPLGKNLDEREDVSPEFEAAIFVDRSAQRLGLQKMTFGKGVGFVGSIWSVWINSNLKLIGPLGM